MPIKGVICGYDETFQSFDTCIRCHECSDPQRNCSAPVYVLKAMRDNHIDRKHAGISASTLTSCARYVALTEKYDYYESVVAGWHKSRGTWLHSMIESDQSPRPGLIREVRLRKPIEVLGETWTLTGKPDEVDTELGILIDYKSKEKLPTKRDEKHEFQFNVYIWLLSGGHIINDDGSEGEQVNVRITKGGMHYVTWRVKEPFKKMAYPVWELDDTEIAIRTRMEPIVSWKIFGQVPPCNAYIRYGPKWICDCVKLETQLKELGTYNE